MATEGYGSLTTYIGTWLKHSSIKCRFGYNAVVGTDPDISMT